MSLFWNRKEPEDTPNSVLLEDRNIPGTAGEEFEIVFSRILTPTIISSFPGEGAFNIRVDEATTNNLETEISLLKVEVEYV